MGSRPYVVAHLAVSVEGAMTGFEPDLARFYALATTWQEDVTLVGADTILAQVSKSSGWTAAAHWSAYCWNRDWSTR
jgi:hypothetical protein